MKRLALTWMVLIVLAGAVPAQDANEEEWKLPSPPDNAAISYCLAMALQPRPYDAEDFEADRFVHGEFLKLPPQALGYRPDAEEFLKNYLNSSQTIWALHRAAQKPRCAFDLDYSQGPSMLLPHLAELRNLARRCAGAAKYQEFNGNPNEAAQIYVDLMRMGEHAGQDPILIGGLVGVAIQGIASREIEGLLSREPPPEAVRTLLAGLQDIEPRPFDVSAYFHGEAEMFGNWFAQVSPADIPKSFESMGGRETKEAASRITTLPPDELDKLYTRWIEEYRAFMNAMAKTAEEPYYKSAALLKEQETQIKKLKDDFLRNPKEGNPLIAILVPALERAAMQFAKAEAQLGMNKLACAVVLHYHEKGKYPESLDDLAAYFPDGLPKDPFTGGDYTYTLVAGWPRVEFAAPEELRRPDNEHLFSIDLSRRRTQDAEAWAWFQKQMEEPEE